MRILLVTMQLGRSYRQGTERYVTTLGRCLGERGHHVHYLAGDPLRFDGRLALGEPVPGHPDIMAYPTRGWMAVRGLPPPRLCGLLAAVRPEIVHVNVPAHIGVGIIAACRQMRIPLVVTVHDYWWICPKGTLIRDDHKICNGTPGWPECIRCVAGDHHRRWVRGLAAMPHWFSPLTLGLYGLRALGRGMSPTELLRWMNRRSYLARHLAMADHLIFPSQAARNLLAEQIGDRPYSVICNGLSAEWFRPRDTGRLIVRPPEELVVGFAGTLAPHKGPHLLLEAIRHLGWHRTRVLLAGSAGHAGYHRELRQRAAGLRVEFTGPLNIPAMLDFLDAVDILAIPSVWPENCPYVLLEAQAAGVVVVAARIGGLPERISDPHLLFKPGCIKGLAATLEYARQHPASAWPQDVPTAEAMTDAVEAVYRDVVVCGRCG